MRKLVVGLVALVIGLIVLLIISYHYADVNTTLPVFFSNLALNVVAELLGVLITLSGVFVYAMFAARRKFESLATPIAELVAQLRCDGTLSPEAARRSMVFAVKLITPENITKKASMANEPLGLTSRPCDVCALPTTVGKGRPCKDCGVEDFIWSIDKKPVPLEVKCKH